MPDQPEEKKDEKVAEILSFKLELRLDATITVESSSGTQDWVKPGAVTGTKWSYTPTEDQLANAIVFMTHHVLEPTMDHVARQILERERALRHQISSQD